MAGIRKPGAGRKPGTPKTGGRKKGSIPKKSKEIAERLEQLGCDPIEDMLRIARLAEKGLPILIDGIPLTINDKEITRPDYAIAGNLYKELAQYVAPKRSAIQHTGADEGPIEVDQEMKIIFVDPPKYED